MYYTGLFPAWRMPYSFNIKIITDLWSSLVYDVAPPASASLDVDQQPFKCPYEYILDVYGAGHFSELVKILDPDLETRDPALFRLVLDIMDVVHFGAILVDDVADHSVLRKGKPAAHLIFGSAETVNRTYLRIFEIINRCQQEKPSLVPFILDNISEIHEGQDISLVWRRDGFGEHTSLESALDAYRACASLKTGALFRLVGQLVRGNHELDEKMSDFGWFCHLQNDCKNVFSSDVVSAKGSLAEDLANGEYSFPILVGLHASEPVKTAIMQAMSKTRGKYHARILHRAVTYMQEVEVRGLCLVELEAARVRNLQLASLWGRKETMSVKV